MFNTITPYSGDMNYPSDASLEQTLADIKAKPVKNKTWFIPTIPAHGLAQDDKGNVIAKPSRSMGNILSVLSNFTEYISTIVVGLDGATDDQHKMFIDTYKPFLGDKLIISHNNDPKMRGLVSEIFNNPLMESSPTQKITFPDFVNKDGGYSLGKGQNMWLGLGFSAKNRPFNNFIAHDSDIVPSVYNERYPKMLLHASQELKRDYDFVKAYYERILDLEDGSTELGGRLRRLLITPLLFSAFESPEKNTADVNKFLMYMDAIKYPLSGEMIVSGDYIPHLSMQPGYKLEISSLFNLFENKESKSLKSKLTQIDLGKFDHAHQSLIASTTPTGLEKMAIEITSSFINYLYQLTVPAGNRSTESYSAFMKNNFSDDYLNRFATLATNIVANTNQSVEANRADNLKYQNNKENAYAATIAGAVQKAIMQVNRNIQKDKVIFYDPEIHPVARPGWLPAWGKVHPDYLTSLEQVILEQNKK